VRTIETKVYTFDELSDSAKEKAREWYREGNLDYEWWDCTYDDAVKCAECLGIEIATRDRNWRNITTGKSGVSKETCIYFSGFCSQGDGACFEGSYSYRKGWRKALKAYAPIDKELLEIGEALQEAQKQVRWGATATIKHSGRYYHERSIDVDVDIPETEKDREREERCIELMQKATEELKPDWAAASKRCSEIKKAVWADAPNTESDISEAMSDFCRWMYKRLEAEHDYLQSDEAVDESIKCNEYEFEEDGSRA
jgi:hypothetical protein